MKDELVARKHVTAARRLSRAGTVALILVAATAVQVAAQNPDEKGGVYRGPNATISFSGGSVAFIGSVQWGSGTLHFRGRRVPIKVTGVGVGAVGANSFGAEGDVFNLRRPSDIVGTYTAINASATAGAGAGVLDMTNEKGVEIRARSTSAGLSLSLAPTGMSISLK